VYKGEEPVTKETLDIILASIQAVGLIALILYVVKTWHIASATREAARVSEKTLQEMKDARDQEVAPHVIAYFDLPLNEHVIYLAIKNVGKSVASNIRIEFEPKLVGHRNEDFTMLPFVRDGIGSMPPGYEIRTFVDTSMAMLAKQSNRSLTYKAKVTFFGGLKETQRTTEQTLDLSMYRGLSSISRRGIHDLTNEATKISHSTEQISKTLSELSEAVTHGLYFRNPTFRFSPIPSDSGSWTSLALSKLTEFKFIWTSTYSNNHDKMMNPFMDNLRIRLIQIGEQLLILAASSPVEIAAELRPPLLEISNKLTELGSIQFYMDGGASLARFDAAGNEIVDLADRTIKQLQAIGQRANAEQQPRPPFICKGGRELGI
jgi:hypothetical protein